MNKFLDLRTALAAGRLEDFIRQEEVPGVLAISPADFDATVASMVKSPRSEDRTSPAPKSASAKRGK
jgi:hypothetical protein